ncbi:uncharacterized protein LOC131228185 isoform X2 [Magnolia sinica]|uniref:uncharacterized protein LOC131228185 isoform X2 n=1 Tax=Magnolia sinica TaxID=86752 RepID=UPI002658B70D|nr:uncharacterized protein LOC131228185 isoform X2 [Magnolia sinica]
MASGLYAATSFSIFSSPFSNSNFPSKRSQIYTPPLISPLSFLCRSHNIHSSSTSSSNLQFVLHDSLDDSGIDTTHARAARDGFCSQIQRLSRIERETSITINRGVDLGKVALHIAAEDDALVSHSSVPLPVDSFIERLDDLSMGFCSLYIPPVGSSPELFLGNLERYFYVHKGFHRSIAKNQLDVQALYLHSVLTRRSGSATMLSLVYSEMLKMLRLCGFLDFDVEIYFPHDPINLPRGYNKHKSKLSDELHILTVQSLLVEILKNLKDAFWPFKYDHAGSLFLRAAYAANCVGQGTAKGGSFKSSNTLSGLEFASAKAAQHRLGRGVWTSVHFGDMRRALAACERLILLGCDSQELRDYSVLLYHCGFYEESFQYLKLYQDSMELQFD